MLGSKATNMRVLFVVLLALAFVAVAAVPTSDRIIGGSLATISDYPTIVALLYSRDFNFYSQGCGGTIINPNRILTAAHCLWGDAVNRWRARVGSSFGNSGGTVHVLQSYLLHPQYNVGASLNNDVALVTTSTSINYINGAVQPASIAGTNYNPADNSVVWAAGWGATYVGGPTSAQLRHVQVWTVNQQVCADRYTTLRYVVTENMLCSGWLDVGGRDQCQGDSGGPLYHNGVVVGVCSWGQRCALAQYPGVNARVSRFTTWIQNNA